MIGGQFSGCIYTSYSRQGQSGVRGSKYHKALTAVCLPRLPVLPASPLIICRAVRIAGEQAGKIWILRRDEGEEMNSLPRGSGGGGPESSAREARAGRGKAEGGRQNFEGQRRVFLPNILCHYDTCKLSKGRPESRFEKRGSSGPVELGATAPTAGVQGNGRPAGPASWTLASGVGGGGSIFWNLPERASGPHR